MPAMTRPQPRLLLALVVAAVALVTGCAMQEKKTMESLNQPVNCATAEGDLRVLQGEKKNVAEQIA
jgi:hypothetical protein